MNPKDQFCMSDNVRVDATKPYIDRINIVHKYDRCPDLSYLEQEYESETPENREKYKAQDKARLDAYYNDEWFCFGIYATADIHVPFGTYVQIVPVKSGGVWGFESDSDENYDSEHKHAIEDLKALLSKLNVEVPDNVQIIPFEEIEH